MHSTNTNTNKTSSRWAIAAGALAIVLGACGAGQTSSTEAEAQPTPAVVADDTNNASIETPAPAETAALAPVPANPAEEPAPSASGQSPVAPAPAPAAAQEGVDEENHNDGQMSMGENECYGIEYPSAEWITIIHTLETLDGATVPVYTEPGHDAPIAASFPGETQLNVLPHSADSCFFDGAGEIWWAVWVSQTESGWINRSVVIDGSEDPDFAEDHVDQPIDEDGVDDGTWEDEEDASYDCFFLNSRPGDCVVVIYSNEGMFVDSTPTAEWVQWAHLECFYQGNTGACDVLNALDYDPVNELTMTPTEFLQADCAELPAGSVEAALACAELATRS
ncbi:MAG: hypothetical protein AAGA37_01175 [Actinomycetota bacterium]